MSAINGDAEFRKIDNYEAISRYDPSMNLGNVATGGDARDLLRVEREQDAQKLLKAAKTKRDKNNTGVLAKIYGTQIGLALGTGLVSVGVCYWLNPPITQHKRSDELTCEKQDWRKVMLLFSIISVSVFFGPEVINLVKMIIR
jgi:hypothetical protein